MRRLDKYSYLVVWPSVGEVKAYTSWGALYRARIQSLYGRPIELAPPLVIVELEHDEQGHVVGTTNSHVKWSSIKETGARGREVEVVSYGSVELPHRGKGE